MYLKSIEVHGFKSFANKIVFQFHNGITAIVGPNGSGKSNVSDAVRWVLGEQSAKQLRGASMQDIIFAGTELRKPMGYASVSITLDNADHKLPVSYDEVTVTRRVYRSGESEYLLNGTQVRLKDINEMFYDTGIGKEGYSIIGQGQIDKILSGKPEDRRELFDEAAGIVKFKRRKNAAQKKLEAERQNLVRVNDILSELTRQLGPLERQAETAKIYLQKRDELRILDANLFLLEFDRLRSELEDTEQKQLISQEQLEETKKEYEKAKADYEVLEGELEQLEEQLLQKREQISSGQLRRGQFENQIQLLKEQINTSRISEEHLKTRIQAIERQLENNDSQLETETARFTRLQKQLERANQGQEVSESALEEIRGQIAELESIIEKGKNDILDLLEQRSTIKIQIQRFDTLAEQTEIRKSQLSKEVLQLKSEQAQQKTLRQQLSEEYEAVCGRIAELSGQSDQINGRLLQVQQELQQLNVQFEKEQPEYHREASRLESLKNIAERYDGYGNSIRRVMEQKARERGILGVVADLFKTEKRYETAIETALGGSIQNIVTDTEETAKRQIEFLKKNKYGRATFLPLSGISGKGGFTNAQALKEKGVIGLASTLVTSEKKYAELGAYLLGKTIVVDHIDNAIALARKYHHSLRIVTLEGEQLSPGGSMSGGAFKNSSNLLGRRREIEELEKSVSERSVLLKDLQSRIDQSRRGRNALRDQLVQLKDQLQKEYLVQNTAKMRLDEVDEKSGSSSQGYLKLKAEAEEIEKLMRDLEINREKEQQELHRSEEKEQELNKIAAENQSALDAEKAAEQTALSNAESVHVQVSQLMQQVQFTEQNIVRIRQEKQQLETERLQYQSEIASADGTVQEKEEQIRQIEESLQASAADEAGVREDIEKLIVLKDEKNRIHKKFFSSREELSERMSLLDRENFRLNAQLEKLGEQKEHQINYMWEEYSLTIGTARELQREDAGSAAGLKKSISSLKSEIRGLGNVNVNAIEDFKELSERHSFLSSQHADLQKAEEALVKIIEELDEGMRQQFREQFARIQTEFDKAFKQLFGGGNGKLELVEDEDILEAGIRIIAQPPGKKLQNMMQLSGGEKSLTAIALLFAIQNLKPSPFCLLDEIEAALDESNVDRYAGYLHKLTKNTQFIIITHRRGTMTAADRLYGITMQEKGVSALVSVNLIENDLDE